MGKRHQPNKLFDYLEIHHTVMRKFVDRGFVLDDGLSFEDPDAGFLEVRGDIICRGGIVLTVRKRLRIIPGASAAATQVQTIEYKYNARVEGRGNILRYDSPHRHRPYHHKHSYDAFDADRSPALNRMGDDDWPTLGKVIGELEAWFFEHCHDLPGGC